VFTDSNAVVNANMKGTQLSNTSSAFTNNSQRKFIRTRKYNNEQWLHCVYESMNKVWYEISTDNGINWSIANNGQPLNEADGKSPSASAYESNDANGHYVVIIYVQDLGINNRKIFVKLFINGEYKCESEITSISLNDWYQDPRPVVAYANGGKVLVVWKRGQGYVDSPGIVL